MVHSVRLRSPNSLQCLLAQTPRIFSVFPAQPAQGNFINMGGETFAIMVQALVLSSFGESPACADSTRTDRAEDSSVGFEEKQTRHGGHVCCFRGDPPWSTYMYLYSVVRIAGRI